MEFEELKSIWKKGDSGYKTLEESDILAMMKGQSQSLVSRLKRSVWFELIFTSIVGIGLFLYALTLPEGALKWISVCILLLFLIFIGYYLKKLVLLRKFDNLNTDLKTAIGNLIDNFEGYLRFYRRSYMVLYPVYMILGMVFGAIEQGVDRYLEHLMQPVTLISIIALVVVFYVISVKGVNWMLQKLYGTHLDKMRELVRDLENPQVQG